MAEFDYSQFDFDKDPDAVSKAAYARLMSLGVQPQTAAGAIGSVMGESGSRLNTKALNPGDGADGSDSIGFGQWNDIRAKNLRTKAAELGKPVEHPIAQIEHMASELQGSHKNVLEALKGAGNDLGAGTDIWTRKYEIPADPDKTMVARANNGLNFFNNIGRNIDPSKYAGATAMAALPAGAPAAAAAAPKPAGTEEDSPAPRARGVLAGAAAPVIDRVPEGFAQAGAQPQGALAPANWMAQQQQAQAQGGGGGLFNGLGGLFGSKPPLGEFGNRIEKAAAWIAPPGNASAVAGIQGAQTNAKTAEANIQNQQFNQQQTLRKNSIEDEDRKKPETATSISPSKKSMLVTRTNKDGTVSVSEIPLSPLAAEADDEKTIKKAAGEKPPNASILKMEDTHKKGFSSSIDLIDNIDEVLKGITNGEMSADAMTQGINYLKNHTDSSDRSAQLWKKAQSAIKMLAQQRVKLEGGNPSDFRIKQAEASILPSGGEYDTAQVADALLRARKVLSNNLRDSASGLGSVYSAYPKLGDVAMPGGSGQNGNYYINRYGDISNRGTDLEAGVHKFIEDRNSSNKKGSSNPLSKMFPGLF